MRLSASFLSLITFCGAVTYVTAGLVESLNGVSGRFKFTYPGLENYTAAIEPCELCSAQ